jgi:hypothetical protein
MCARCLVQGAQCVSHPIKKSSQGELGQIEVVRCGLNALWVGADLVNLAPICAGCERWERERKFGSPQIARGQLRQFEPDLTRVKGQQL